MNTVVFTTRLVVRFTMVDNSTEREYRRTLIEVEPKYVAEGGAYYKSTFSGDNEAWIKSWAEKHAPRIADGLLDSEHCHVEWSIIEHRTNLPSTSEREVFPENTNGEPS